MKRPEQELHFLVADYLRAQYPALLWLHPNNNVAFRGGARLGGIYKRMGVLPGAPDFLLFFERDNIPHMAAIELKANKGRLSDTQTDFMRRFTAIGGLYACCRTLDEVREILAHWQVPKFTQCPARWAENSKVDGLTVKPRGKK